MIKGKFAGLPSSKRLTQSLSTVLEIKLIASSFYNREHCTYVIITIKQLVKLGQSPLNQHNLTKYILMRHDILKEM